MLPLFLRRLWSHIVDYPISEPRPVRMEDIPALENLPAEPFLLVNKVSKPDV